MTSLQSEDVIFIKDKVISFIHFVCKRNIKVLKSYIEYFYSDDIEKIILNDLEAFLVNTQEFFNYCVTQTSRIDVFNEISQTAVDIYNHPYKSPKIQSQINNIFHD